LCAARCPTEAVKMETFRFTEEVVFEKPAEGGRLA
jgi:ferredoxin